MRRGALIGSLVLAAVAASAGTSHGAVTIGSNLAAAPNISPNIAGMQTSVQETLLPSHTAAGGLTAPTDGVVVRFRYRQTVPSSLPFRFRIVRPVMGIATSTAAGTSPDFLHEGGGVIDFPVRMPIMAGDAIGIDCCDGAAHSGFAKGPDPPDPGALGIYRGWNGPVLADGGAARLFNNSDQTLEILINADIEPDLDKDGFGDETQDGCPTNSNVQGTCPLLPVHLPGGINPPSTTPAKKCKKKPKKAGEATAAKKKCGKRRKRS